MGKLKSGKTTGMSRVSAELLKHLVGLSYGLLVLTDLLNMVLKDPAQANLHLAEGWVILLPKKSWVQDATDFRPIVCGEVFAKLAAKLATARVVSSWPVPRSCFGCVANKGVAEAIYVIKHAAQESAGLAEPPVFVQLDVSRAFDSLNINSVLQYMIDHWSSASAKSAGLLRWVLLHSRLRFQLFDASWWCLQGRGTQQGGSHSPTLFGRVLSGRFDQLSHQWLLCGERPAFVTSLLALWALWFIDDSIFIFRTLSQLLRLMPAVVDLLQNLGLSINVSKSCLLASSLPRCLPGFLGTFPVQATSVYLGMPLKVVDTDEHMVDYLCARATTAYFTNKRLLTHCSACRPLRLRLFTSLVTASIRWCLCVVSVNQTNLRKLRIHHVTLLAWTLGARAHNSWFVGECIATLRHAVKLWSRTYSETWDALLAKMVWRWVGHVLRLPSTDLVRQSLTELQHSDVTAHGIRRCRTGPNNSGHRNVIRYLNHCGLDAGAAACRQQWAEREHGWLVAHGLPVAELFGANVYAISSTKYLWERRCLQGTFPGQQLIVCDITDSAAISVLELDRCCGWRCHRAPVGTQSIHDILELFLATGWLRPSTFHLKVLLFHQDSHAERLPDLLGSLPIHFHPFDPLCIVTEICTLPLRWLGDMTRLANELVC